MAIMKQKETTTVFVYGTLKNDHSNHGYLRNSRFIGEFKTNPKWALLDLGPYPAMIVGHLEVKGEVYEIDYDTLADLDMLEGVAVGLYTRERIILQGTSDSAWAYIMEGVPRNDAKLLEEW